MDEELHVPIASRNRAIDHGHHLPPLLFGPFDETVTDALADGSIADNAATWHIRGPRFELRLQEDDAFRANGQPGGHRGEHLSQRDKREIRNEKLYPGR